MDTEQLPEEIPMDLPRVEDMSPEEAHDYSEVLVGVGEVE